MKTFTLKENKVLTEVYRRIIYFHENTVDSKLIYLGYPSEVKTLIEKGYLKCYG